MQLSRESHLCSSRQRKSQMLGFNNFGQLGYGDTDDRGGICEMGDNLPYVDA